MASEQAPRTLSDRQYEDLIVGRVRNELRAERQRSLRWWIAILLSIAAIFIGELTNFYTLSQVSRQSSALEQVFINLEELKLLVRNPSQLDLVVDRINDLESLVLSVQEGDVEDSIPRPIVDGLGTEFSQAERLVINGNSFGSESGSVELFYEPSFLSSLSQNETMTITLQGAQIQQWTANQITATTTPEQRQDLLTSIEADNFDELVPYITVLTADGQRSPLW